MNNAVYWLVLPGLLRILLVAPLRCYECELNRKKSNNTCLDPLDTTHDDVRVTQCQDPRETCLIVKTQFINGDIFYQRKCGKANHKDSCKDLHLNGTGYMLDVEVCSCQTDLCNTADSMSALSSRTIAFITFLWAFLL
uniref:Protein sleepless n=1 Tax=Magallana gigas TaxID=29159 RepID=A0A8W8L174_MAGGI|nr:uncharacterized protein LOC105329417 [Crassostrea gigas]